ncbi:MAG TPA: SDR family NAD(P)-dependent oxidoreductase [Chloroflexota bacterium]|nr:SDR family NAD(P)-dependent oxidoreductase [Chloroflexota bacterium]
MTGTTAAGRLEGVVAVITGGARGIGGATATRFAAEGARVIIGDLLDAEAHETVAVIRAAGGEAHYVRTDVTDEEQCRALCQAAVDRYGQVDAIVTCAGVLQGAFTPLEDFDLETFERVQDINVRGTFLSVKHAVGHMKQSGGGVVICISSGAGVSGGSSSIAYGTSKAGVHGFVKCIEDQLRRAGIRAHAVCPGSVDTPLKRQNVADGARASGRDPEQALATAGLVDPAGIAGVLAFLASDEGSYVRGTVFTR